MPGNYHTNFHRYKRNLRWKATMRKKGSFVREAEYNGWSNWDTWHTALMMDNDEDTYRRSRALMENGADPEELGRWATQHIIGPHNQQRIQEAQEWNEIPREERERMKRDRDIAEYGEQAVNLGGGLFDAMGHDPYREEEVEAPDMMMDPQLVNWPEIHQNILSEYEPDHPIHQLQQPQELQVPQAQPDPDQPGDFTLPQGWE